MGFKFNNRHSRELGIGYTTESMPITPSKRQTEVTVQGRDGAYIFEDGYDNIQIQFLCSILGESIVERRKRAREIASWLSTTGTLIMDYEPDVEYKVIKVINDIQSTILAKEYRDTFNIVFVCEPYQSQTYYNDNLTWEDIDSPWDGVFLPWNGYERKFAVNSETTLIITNAGTYKALPIIILDGVATSIQIGSCSYTNLNGKVYIDCKNQVVYSIVTGSKINKISNFTGSFIELLPGDNIFSISGINLNLTIEFDYKNVYL